MPRGCWNCSISGLIVALWAEIFKEHFTDPSYRARKKEAKSFILVFVTSVFQDIVWRTRKDGCGLWIKTAHVEKKAKQVTFLNIHFHPFSMQKKKKKGGRNLLSKAGNRRNTGWETAHLALMSPSWPSGPTPILSLWRTVKHSFSAPERMTSVQTGSVLEGVELFLDLGTWSASA